MKDTQNYGGDSNIKQNYTIKINMQFIFNSVFKAFL